MSNHSRRYLCNFFSLDDYRIYVTLHLVQVVIHEGGESVTDAVAP